MCRIIFKVIFPSSIPFIVAILKIGRKIGKRRPLLYLFSWRNWMESKSKAFNFECFSNNSSISFWVFIILSKSTLVAVSFSLRCILLLYCCFSVPAENPWCSKQAALIKVALCCSCFIFDISSTNSLHRTSPVKETFICFIKEIILKTSPSLDTAPSNLSYKICGSMMKQTNPDFDKDCEH